MVPQNQTRAGDLDGYKSDNLAGSKRSLTKRARATRVDQYINGSSAAVPANLRPPRCDFRSSKSFCNLECNPTACCHEVDISEQCDELTSHGANKQRGRVNWEDYKRPACGPISSSIFNNYGWFLCSMPQGVLRQQVRRFVH